MLLRWSMASYRWLTNQCGCRRRDRRRHRPWTTFTRESSRGRCSPSELVIGTHSSESISATASRTVTVPLQETSCDGSF